MRPKQLTVFTRRESKRKKLIIKAGYPLFTIFFYGNRRKKIKNKVFFEQNLARMIDNRNNFVEDIATPNTKVNTLSPIITPIRREVSDINSIFELPNISTVDYPDLGLGAGIVPVTNALESDIFVTPSSNDKVSCCCNEIQESDNFDTFNLENTIDNTGICAVCLSPLCKIIVVETKCKHVFHQQCLEEAKSRIAKCPLCRTELSPTTIPNNFISRNMRESVVAAAQRGRNAVRLAILRNSRVNISDTNFSNTFTQ